MEDNSYKLYIANHLKEVKECNRQYNPLNNYASSLNELTEKSATLKGAIDLIKKEKEIGRDFIFKLFKDGQMVIGFWVTLLWGNLSIKYINLAVKDEVETNTKAKLKAEKHPTIEERLNNVAKLLSEKDIEGAFISLLNGTKKIKGVGISFLTKLLYFISGKDYSGNPKPLIYDRWTRGIDAVLISEGVLPISENYYLSFGTRGGFNLPIFPKNESPVSMYMNYLKRMSELASSFKDKSIGASDLEEYLFGESKLNSQKWNQENPRYILMKYLKTMSKNEINGYQPHKKTGKNKEKVEKDENNKWIQDEKGGQVIKYSISSTSPDLFLYIGTDGKHKGIPKALPFYCELIIKERKRKLTELLDNDTLEAISNVLDYRSRYKRYIYSTYNTTLKDAEATFDNALTILKSCGAF